MISYMIYVMNLVRVQILEGFILPELGISYWDFCIALLIVGLIIKVLVNSVKKESSNVKANNKGKNKDNSSGQNSNGLTAEQLDELDKINRGY